MGRFSFNSHVRVDVEDRPLAHLQIVMGNKLRRGESFFFTWREDPSVGDGRRAVWIHPAADLDFKYFGSRAPHINRMWLEKLAQLANGTTGLYLVSEPPEDGQASVTTMDVI
ncbi:ATP-dependent DNA ligase [Microbacterium sp. NPDC079995]|uniref:DUF7882 family protein n=1 Tax=unclassified Microbacterium TaxID=2609290 RepID=UPI00345024DE